MEAASIWTSAASPSLAQSTSCPSSLSPRCRNSPKAAVTNAITYFLDYYRKHKLDFTFVYPTVPESLEAIRSAHPEVLMAVLTNKPVNPSREICAHFGLDRFFFQNYGGNSFHTD